MYTYDATYLDRLVNCGGTSVSYNAMGCPTTYNGYAASWTRGKLSKLSKGNMVSGTHNYEYSYNAFGQRVGRSYSYTLGTLGASAVQTGMLMGYSKVFRYDQSGRLIYESKSSEYYNELDSFETIVYLYDENSIVGMDYTANGQTNTYYFQRNLLGDVVGIYNTSGTKVGGYVYDAWGNCTITLNTNGIASLNPIRYRGYYYDTETGLYYLNARYYSPEWRRFISPDAAEYIDPETPNGLNLYAYCNNDPVNYADPSGHFVDYILDAIFIAIGIKDFVEEPSWEKAGWLALDIGLAIAPIIPAVSGVRHLGKIDDAVDLTKTFGHIDNFVDAGGVIRRAKKKDFVDDGWALVQSLNRTDEGFTISNHVIGTKIHTTFMKSFKIDAGNIADGINIGRKTVFELKPYNVRNIRKGIKQLYRYKAALEATGRGVYKMVLVLY